MSQQLTYQPPVQVNSPDCGHPPQGHERLGTHRNAPLIQPTRASHYRLLLLITEHSLLCQQLKEVVRIKIFRKMQQKVELKIRHGLATGKLPQVERSPGSVDASRQGIDKIDGTRLGQSK